MLKAIHDKKFRVKGSYILSNGAGEEKDGRQGLGNKVRFLFFTRSSPRTLRSPRQTISLSFVLGPEAPFRG